MVRMPDGHHEVASGRVGLVIGRYDQVIWMLGIPQHLQVAGRANQEWRMKRAPLGAVIVGLSLVVVACSASSDETTTTAPTTTVAASATSSTSSTTTLPTTTTTSRTLTATATTLVVQGDLTALGYFEGTIDGIAGEETKSAIARFQADVGLEADGEFGPNTDAAMVPLLQDDVPYVENVQKNLTEMEFYSGPIDGDYGKGTEAAVKRLQTSCEIEETGQLEIDTRICLAGL